MYELMKYYNNKHTEYFHDLKCFLNPFLATSLCHPQPPPPRFVITNGIARHKAFFSITLFQHDALTIHLTLLHLWVGFSFYCRVVSHHVDVPQFIHSPVHRHLGCSQSGTLMNNAAMNIPIQALGQTSVFIALESIPGVGWLLHMLSFIFQSGWTILHSHQQCSTM